MDSLQPLYQFTFDNLPSRSAVSKKLGRQKDHAHPSLLRLLAVAGTLEVNVLPLTWRPALEELGQGATGQVSQSPLNAQLSLAFKRFSGTMNGDGDLTESELRRRQYDAIVSEVVALSTSKIYDHPNIANLEGICWEVEKFSGEIWPVLAFRKAECGSLNHFLSLPDAEDMDFHDLIDVCGEVAKGLRIMHLCNIVHGDIKPDNILVFKSAESGIYGVKITDFGYSSFGSSEDDEVKLPLSTPWEAPEYHDRWFPLKAAKRLDVYSFGLLALWLLFRDRTLVLDNGIEIKISNAFTDHDGIEMANLQHSKRNGTLLPAILRLTSQKADLADHQRQIIDQLFTLSLELASEKRATDMQPFVELLCKSENLEPLDRDTSVPQSTIGQDISWHGNVQIRNFFFELDSCDFRIQAAIAKDLGELARQECESCRENAAFQLALCYLFGFGVRAHPGTSNEWLSRSGKRHEELNAVINDIKHMKAPSSSARQIINLGYQSQLASDYEGLGILELAIAEYRAMAISRQNAFGQEHFSSQRMWSQLAGLLQRTGALEEACEIYLQQLSVLARLFGPNHDTGILKSHLARTYADMKQFDEAESMARESLESFNPDSRQDDALRLAAFGDLAFIALESRRYDSAIERALATIQESHRYLGQSHPVTFRARGILALAYSGNGETEKAVKLMEDVIVERKESLGLQHPDTINFMQRIGPLYVDLDNWTTARDRFKELVDVLTQSDPARFSKKSSVEILVAQSNYAGALVRTGDVDTAAELLEQLIAHMPKLLEASDVRCVHNRANLAIAYQYQGRWEEAEPLQREVVKDFKQRFGPSDPRTLMATANLTDTLYSLKQWKEVAGLGTEEVQLRQEISSNPSEATLNALLKAGRSCFRVANWMEAVTFLEQEVQMRLQLSVIEGIEGLEATALLALGCLHLARLEDAKTYIGDFFDLFLRCSKARETLVGILYEIAASAEKSYLLEEAEELLKLAVLLRRSLSPGLRQDSDDTRDEDNIKELRQRQSKPLEEVTWDPTAIIERTRRGG